ncbi:MAG: S8 family peptidase [Candidatus Sulfotelmatobacter sp.]
MFQTRKSKGSGRGERHSAAWGKRLGTLLLVLLAQTTFGQGFGGGRPVGKFAPDLAPQVERAHQGTAGNETVQVIVQYKQVPQSAQEGRVQHLGARLNHRLGMVKGIALTIPVSALPALEADPEILSVSVDHPMKGLDDTTDVVTGAPSAWTAGLNGTGITVAVIDSGINDSHPDLLDSTESHSRVLYHQDFTGTPNTNSNGGKYDLYGHGTHVAGIIGGNGYMSGGNYSGMAPNVSFVDLRALDLYGVGTDSTVIAAIQEAIALKSTYNIKVINLSLGRGIFVSYTQDPLCQAVESAWKAGIVVVVAAGNYGRVSVNGSNGFGTITAPGNDPYVLTVGAMKSNGSTSQSAETLASYSSKGPTTYDHVVKPDIVAPGNDVVSLAAPGATLESLFPAELVTGNDGNNDYFTLSGTSMATPAVSGAVALLLQQNSALTPDQVKARLMKTTYKLLPTSTVAWVPHLSQNFTSTYDLFSVGSGLLNLQTAISNTDLAPATVGAAFSPSVVYNPNTGTVSLVNGNSSVSVNSVVWGSSVVWGTSVVWGANVTGSSVVWGSSLPWNSNLLSAFSVVWGSSTSTGTQATSVVWGAAVSTTDGAFSDAGDDEQ